MLFVSQFTYASPFESNRMRRIRYENRGWVIHNVYKICQIALYVLQRVKRIYTYRDTRGDRSMVVSRKRLIETSFIWNKFTKLCDKLNFRFVFYFAVSLFTWFRSIWFFFVLISIQCILPSFASNSIKMNGFLQLAAKRNKTDWAFWWTAETSFLKLKQPDG